jgi:hypothetical protein
MYSIQKAGVAPLQKNQNSRIGFGNSKSKVLQNVAESLEKGTPSSRKPYVMTERGYEKAVSDWVDLAKESERRIATQDELNSQRGIKLSTSKPEEQPKGIKGFLKKLVSGIINIPIEEPHEK